MIRPILRPGATVGIAALSSRVDPVRLARGSAVLASWGYAVRPAANLTSVWGNFAGRDGERLDGFHTLVADDDVEAIFFARGGHGLLRLMDRIDWELIAAHPKAYVGYSDLTPFLLHVAQALGIVTFHGPMVATDLEGVHGEAERQSLVSVLENRPVRPYPCTAGVGCRSVSALEGRLLGGCLSLLVSLLGTPYFPDLEGSLLFIEDVNEPFHRLDRMLTHLRLSGSLNGVKAMILGHLEAVDQADSVDFGSDESFSAALEGVAPVAWGAPFGHGRPNLTVPIGASARLDLERGELTLIPS